MARQQTAPTQESHDPGEIDLQLTGPFAPMQEASRDGRLLVGRLENGEEVLMRWRSAKTVLEEEGPDDQKPAHWARWHGDIAVTPLAWAPTALTMFDVLDRA